VPQLQSAAQWREVAGYHVIEPLQAWLAQARGRFAQDPAFQKWLEEFAPRINSLLAEVERYLAAGQQGVSDQIRQRLQQAGYPDANDSLSQMALRVLAGLDGLSCVLVGMRRAEYVEDVMEIADRELIDSLPIFSRFSLRNS
jgi:aryl-alcohol dehydrogenase-like predicted oxidoreductase